MISSKHQKFLIGYIKRSSIKSFVIIFLLISISILLEAAFIKSLEIIINNIKDLEFNKIIYSSFFSLGLIVSCSIFKILQTKFYVRYSAYLGKMICKDCIKGYFGENIQKTKERDSSDLINSIIVQSGYIIKGVIFSSLNLITYSLVCLAIIFVLLASLGYAILFTIFSVLILYILIAKYNRDKLENLSAKQVHFINKITNQILYLINNKRKVYLNRTNSKIFENVFYLNSRYRDFIVNQTELQALPKFYVETFAIISLLILLISLAANKDLLIITKTGSIFFGILRLLPNFQLIYFSWSSIKSSSSQIDAFLTYKDNFKFKDIQIKDNNKINQIRINTKTSKIINLKKGQSLCICGKSGCGKTTFLDQICKLSDDRKYETNFLNIYGKEIDREFLQRQIAYVEQDVFLEDRTIKDIIFDNNLKNINYDVKQVIRFSDLSELKNSDFWEKKTIGTTGGNLSGGQRQRVAIAEAIAWKPSVLILDEATAGIDRLSEDKIWNNLLRNKDIIIIAVTHNSKIFDKFDHLIDLSMIKK